MNLEITLTADDIKRLVVQELERVLGDVPLDTGRIIIETKSSQNYKSEWEIAHYRVRYVAGQ